MAGDKAKMTWKERFAAQKETRDKLAQAAEYTPDCCIRHGTCIFIILNAIFFLMGLILIIMGIVALSTNLADVFGRGPGAVILTVGFVMFAAVIIGLCGQRRENRCLLVIYFFLKVLVLVVLIIAGLVLVGPGKDTLTSKLSDYWTANVPAATDMEKAFGCCGFMDPTDRPYGCNSTFTAFGKPIDNMDEPLAGCVDASYGNLKTRVIPVGSAAVAFGFLLIVNLVFAIKLMCHAGRGNSKLLAGVKGANKWNNYKPQTEGDVELEEEAA